MHHLKLALMTRHPRLDLAIRSAGAASALDAIAPPPEVSYGSVPFQGVTARFRDAWDNLTGLPVRTCQLESMFRTNMVFYFMSGRMPRERDRTFREWLCAIACARLNCKGTQQAQVMH